MNVMHIYIQITDQVYSRQSINEINLRVEQLGKKQGDERVDLEADFKLLQQFLEWHKHKK
jgi:hypothetical protein